MAFLYEMASAYENGGDRHVVLADLMSLPGLAAWCARCSDATAGLKKLVGLDLCWDTA